MGTAPDGCWIHGLGRTGAGRRAHPRQDHSRSLSQACHGCRYIHPGTHANAHSASRVSAPVVGSSSCRWPKIEGLRRRSTVRCIRLRARLHLHVSRDSFLGSSLRTPRYASVVPLLLTATFHFSCSNVLRWAEVQRTPCTTALRPSFHNLSCGVSCS